MKVTCVFYFFTRNSIFKIAQFGEKTTKLATVLWSTSVEVLYSGSRVSFGPPYSPIDSPCFSKWCRKCREIAVLWVLTEPFLALEVAW